MNIETIVVDHEGGRLVAVPAIHFNHIFAAEVNRICRCRKIGVEAVAVELGPQSTRETAGWIRELCVSGNGIKEIPVMLGLLKPNRMIHSSLKKKVLKLQRKTGRDLSEMPPEMLYRELGFCGFDVLALSPTDSIIEAIRCAIELKIPLYGIDLEEMANVDIDHEALMIEDPAGEKGNVAEYISRNAGYVTGWEIPETIEISTRREVVMAARLKALMKQYKILLFTCGMGHWRRIAHLIRDDSLRPANSVAADNGTRQNFARIILHPGKAVEFMGYFPALVTHYQKMRKPAFEQDSETGVTANSNPFRIFEGIIDKACREYFLHSPSNPGRDLHSLGSFDSYLKNLCVVDMRCLPDMFTALQAAQGIMSEDFVKTLTKTFMDFPWASPKDFPAYPILAYSARNTNEEAFVLMGKDGIINEGFYVRSIPSGNKHTNMIRLPYEWEEINERQMNHMGGDVLHTWPPWDCLITSMAMRAAATARTWKEERPVVSAKGSLLDGIAIRETVRALTRGENKLYVYDRTRKRKMQSAFFTGDGFPVVFILEPGEHRHSEWSALYVECSWMENYVRNRERLHEIKKKKGGKMISLIGYGQAEIESKITRKNAEIHINRYYGIVLYQPDCWELGQFARWMEMTHFKRNPFCSISILDENIPSDLAIFLENTHGIRIGRLGWSTTLILLSIPFAKDAITVVCPDNFQFEPIVHEYALRYGVKVHRVSLSSFTSQERRRLSCNYMAPAIRYDPTALFALSIEKAIGESQTMYRDLVPRSCLNYGKH